MKHPRLVSILGLAAALAACSTPQSRIKRRQAEFDSYPPEVQRAIRAGQADVGFTREQVALALGRPDRMDTLKTAAGVQDVWLYGIGSGGPRVGLGFGLGAGPGAVVGGGVGAVGDVGLAPDASVVGDARLRVVFQGERAVSVESGRK